MPFINVGAYVDGRRPKSKKALKEAIRDTPDKVTFDGTSGMGPQFSGGVANIPVGATLAVTGPDPYNARNWYANVSQSGGKVKVT
jgi:hypothetical protein